MEIEYREFDIRAGAEDGTVEGIAVPYNQVTERRGYKESFAPGAFASHLGSVPLFYGHSHLNGGMPIGVAHTFTDQPDGLHFKAKLSDVAGAKDVHTLMKDGALTKASIGFSPAEGGSEMRDGVMWRTAGTLHELSIVPIPAYSGAAVTSVRDAETETPPETPTRKDAPVDLSAAPEITELRSGLEDIERRMATINTNANASNGSQFRSAAEWLKGLASDTLHDAAVTEVRTFAGSGMADGSSGRPAWIERQLQFVSLPRKTINLFSKGPLPEVGMSYSYPRVSGTTGDVAVQALEGDAVVQLKVDTALVTNNVTTYAGGQLLSRQVIERNDLNYLEAAMRFQAISYGKVTEAAARTALLAATPGNTVALGATVAAATGKQWIAALVDAASDIETTSFGLTAEFFYVAQDVFKALATLTDSTGRPLFSVDLPDDGANSLGDVNIVSGALQVGGLPVVRNALLPSGTMLVGSSQAFVTRESAGAPVALLWDDVTHLTRAYTSYGYAGFDTPDLNGLVAISHA